MKTLRRDNNRRHSTVMLWDSVGRRMLRLNAITMLVMMTSLAQAAEPSHWAYRRPVSPPLPSVRDTTWPQNPIDHFVLARLEKERLSPSPPTDRARLIRRM